MIDLEPSATASELQLAFTYVGDAVDAADAIENMAAPVPAAYVSTARESAAPNRNSTGGIRRWSTADLSVLLAVGRSARTPAAGRPVDSWKKRDVIDKLIGWTPSGANLPFDYVSFPSASWVRDWSGASCCFRSKYLRPEGRPPNPSGLRPRGRSVFCALQPCKERSFMADETSQWQPTAETQAAELPQPVAGNLIAPGSAPTAARKASPKDWQPPQVDEQGFAVDGHGFPSTCASAR
jgi:hypothetical protein